MQFNYINNKEEPGNFWPTAVAASALSVCSVCVEACQFGLKCMWSAFFLFWPSLASKPFSFLPLTQCDGCLDDTVWRLMAGLWGLPTGADHCRGAHWSQWRPPAIPGTHLLYAVMLLLVLTERVNLTTSRSTHWGWLSSRCYFSHKNRIVSPWSAADLHLKQNKT